MSLSTSTPRISVVSASEPPTLPSTLMRSNGTSFLERSATARTASTAICANCWCSFETLYHKGGIRVSSSTKTGIEVRDTNILLPRLVIAVFRRFDVLVFENSTVSEILSKCFTARAHARSKPSAIRVGWMPRSSKASLCSSNAPASTRI